MKGKGNSYTTHFRLFDPRLGRWLSTDPKFKSFPAESPYHYAYNSPLMANDPRGDENIVLVGNQSKADGTDDGPSSDFKENRRSKGYRYGKNKRHFLENALSEAKKMKKANSKEATTIVVYKGNYTNEEITHYKKRAKKAGIYLFTVDDDSDAKDYVNKKRTWTWFGSTGYRDEDPITDFTFIGHGGPKKMLLGYNHDKGEWLKADHFNSSAFSDKCTIKLRSCGRAMGEMFETFLTYTNGSVSGYKTTVVWGGAGLGTYAPHNKEYVPLNERDSPDRKDMPSSKAIKNKKGTKK